MKAEAYFVYFFTTIDGYYKHDKTNVSNHTIFTSFIIYWVTYTILHSLKTRPLNLPASGVLDDGQPLRSDTWEVSSSKIGVATRERCTSNPGYLRGSGQEGRYAESII